MTNRENRFVGHSWGKFTNDFHSWLSRVKIIGESPHSWLDVVIHDKPCIILYIISYAIAVTS